MNNETPYGPLRPCIQEHYLTVRMNRGVGKELGGGFDWWKFFFFKQKTAYEISACLVGSEMCIRDRTTRVSNKQGEVRFKREIFISLP